MQTSHSSRPASLSSLENWFRTCSRVGVAVLLILSTATILHAQGVAISTTNAAPHASAILDAMATNKGLLIPRMTQVQRNGIVAPANGLLVYVTDVSPGIYYFDQTLNSGLGKWVKIIQNNQPLTNADNTNINMGSSASNAEILRLNLSNGSSTADALHVNHEGPGNAIRAENINSNGTAVSGASAGTGVYGQGGGAAGSTGVRGESGWIGVEGIGTLDGVVGAGGASGVWGSTSGTDDPAAGVFGNSAVGSFAAGVKGDGSAGPGVLGSAGASNAAGVFGIGYGGNFNVGVSGHSASGTGVRATTNGSDGVNSQSNGSNGNGVVGIANNGTNAYGVWGRSTSGYGVVCSGKFSQGGGAFEASPTSTTWTTNKPATVKLADGSKVKLFAEEAAEVYFNDYGEGRLSDGRAHIELDSKFLQTVTIDQAHPMRVFVQPADECNGMFVTNRSSSGFDVVELHDGKSNAGFIYRIVCKRKYYEDERLATEEQDIQYNKRMLETVWPEVVAQNEKARQMDERIQRESESTKAMEERLSKRSVQRKAPDARK